MAIQHRNSGKAAARKLTSGIFTVLCGLATVIALIALFVILYSLFQQGIGGLNLNIFTMDTPAAGSVGGLRNAIVGSIEMCGAAMVLALVIGVLAGTWLAEIGGDTSYGHAVRFRNDVLLSAPSILVGLFIYQLLVAPLHGFSGWAGAVALALIATPIVTRTTEDILNLQSNALREAGMAMGGSQFVTIRKIIWKAAGAGLLTGGLLGFARISGETAPLLLTTLSNSFLDFDMSHPQASLPVTMNNFALTPYDDLNKLAWVAALLVAIAVLAINIIGRWMARDKSQS
jgi:phosphate transport system permease protein